MFYRLKTDEEEMEVMLEKATAIQIDSKMISKVVENIKYFFIPQHLKRVKKIDDNFLFLLGLGNISKDQILEKIGKNSNKISDYILSRELILIDIPIKVPCTQSQYDAARKIWPCNYSNIQHEEIDQKLAIKMIKIIKEKARSFFGFDKSTQNDYNKKLKKSNDFKSENNCGEEVILNIEHPNNCNLLDVRCACITLIANNKEIVSFMYDHEFLIGHSILEAVSNVSKSKIGYLCTGLTAYLLKEPCNSCAMALVHGRIKNVFCLEKSNEKNSSFSGLRLNYNKNTNHRFNVYFFDDK